jgi:hypothetical protein
MGLVPTGRGNMRKISEYEERAAECRKMAAKTRNPLHKQQLEDMARAWEMLLGVRWKQVERRLRRGPLERAGLQSARNKAHSTR